MKITVLGSGTYQPVKDKNTASYLVQIGKENIVFDFGRGCINQLLKAGVAYQDIDTIFITHAHGDHCNDLTSFLHIATCEPPNAKLRKKDITIHGPKGIKQTIQHLLQAINIQDRDPEFKIHVKELQPGDTVTTSNWSVKTFEASHSDDINCACYRMESNEKVFSYSGDSADCEGLRKCCENADLAILEANSPSSEPLPRHLTGETAAKLAKETNVKKLVLTHIGLYYKKNFDPKKEAETVFKNVVIAEDMMQIEV